MGEHRRETCIICGSRIDPSSKRRTLCSDGCSKERKKLLFPKYNARQKEKGWPNRKKWLELRWESRLLVSARAHAQNKGLNIDITLEDINIPEKCPVLGIPLFFTKGKRTRNTPTIDRINNAKGYVRGNIVVVSWRANDLKKDATVQELRRLAKFYGEITDE